MNSRLWEPPLLNSWEKPLIQEAYWPDRWKMLVCCQMLNLTSYKQVLPIIDGFFQRWPTASAAADADENEMKNYIKTLGRYNRRAKSIIRMSDQFLKGFKNARQLHGCGKYADDSDKIFYLGDWQSVSPTDGALKRYLDFLNEFYDQVPA